MINFLIQQGECASPELSGIIFIVKKIFDIIELFAPLTLLVMLIVNLAIFMFRPEDKKQPAKIRNSIFACVIIFFIPMLVNLVMNVAGNNFSVSACWNEAEQVSNKSTYVDPNDNKQTSILIDPSEYQNGVPSQKKEEE